MTIHEYSVSQCVSAHEAPPRWESRLCKDKIKSHGTQDNLPTFLQAQLKLGVSSTSIITIIANICAIIGGTLFGYYSQDTSSHET